MRILFLFVFLIFSGCKCSPDETVLAKACRWLWARQAADGGWHSETHGILKGGEALTPYVLHTLLAVPDSVFPKPAGKIEKALDFIRQSIDSAGHVGLADAAVVEYPNYATAYALRVLVRYGAAKDSTLVRQLAAYLTRQQFTEQREIYPEHPVYGAWGFGENLAPGAFGQVDLSHTRRVLQALREYGKTDTAVFQHARMFLRLLQKSPEEPRPQPPDQILPARIPYDGGFYSSPVIWGSNKAGVGEAAPRYFTSYATATADGLLSLLAAGIPPSDTRVQDALSWLRQHPDWSYPGGIPRNNPAQWGLVLTFYHIAARAEAYAALKVPAGEWQPLYDILKDKQQPGGHFFNPFGAPNKEDDPILATAFGVLALGCLLSR